MKSASGELFPVLPLRDIVVFPHMIVPLFVGRDKSVRALEDVMKDDKKILLVAQKPYLEQEDMEDFAIPAKDEEQVTQTFCGT